MNGVKLNYRVMGKGEPLVLIAGWGTDLRAWVFQLRAFRKRFRVVAFDNRGVGKSDMPSGPYSMRLLAEDVIGLMDRLQITAANVLGLSMGGMIAQEVAINYPHRVLKLVLGSTFACQHGGSGPTDEYMKSSGLDAVETRIRLAWLANNRPLARFFIVLLVRLIARTGLGGFESQGAAIRTHDTSDRLHLIKAPTLVLTGTKDRVIRPSSSDLIASKIPKARLVEIRNGSHSINSENRKEFNKEVLSFLTGSEPMTSNPQGVGPGDFRGVPKWGH